MNAEIMTGVFGARVTGIDVSSSLGSGDVQAVRRALDNFGVVFFPGQPILGAEQQVELAGQFGVVETPPLLTAQSEHPQVLVVEFERPKGGGADVWHADGTHLEQPPMGTFLQAHILPDAGGDTCFSCMYSAYEALSPAIKTMLESLSARHSTEKLISKTRSRGQYDAERFSVKPPVSHPMVTVNRATGRRRLFINSLYTIGVDGLSDAEGDYLLSFLFDHIKSPEFQLRYRWRVGDLAFWDNHAVQHYAVADYTQRRRMQRVTLLGDSPVGVRDFLLAG
jgi:taurine dioxygenase